MISALQIQESRVSGVRMYEMPCLTDPTRGHLTSGETPGNLPFIPQRYFIIFGVPPDQTRGNHAHLECAQFIIATHGQCRVQVHDGTNTQDFVLNRPNLGLLVPPLIWITLDQHSHDSTLLVLASKIYEPDDYIWDYTKFLSILHHRKSAS